MPFFKIRVPFRRALFSLIMLLAVGLPAELFAWRSILYPTDWTPTFTDHVNGFLHDFSYAGYHSSDIPVPVVSGPTVFDVVVGYGADPTGVADATAAIQAAIDAAEVAGAGIVYFPTGLYRCNGKLLVQGDNTVLRGDGPNLSRLYFTQCDAGVSYDGHIKFRGNVQWGSEQLLTTHAYNRQKKVEVLDVSGYTVGQEIAIGFVITNDFIAAHGMTGTWLQFNGQWRPFFRRKITAINTAVWPPEIWFDVPLRYDAYTRDFASVRSVITGPSNHGYLKESGIEDLGISNAGVPSCATSFNQVQAIVFQDAADCWVRNVRSFASPNVAALGDHLQSGGIDIESSTRITVTDCQMQKAQNVGPGGNGYLFQVTRSNEVLFKDCIGAEGRHNFIQNWDFGTAGCVWLRCDTSLATNEFGLGTKSEYHHSLAMACLVDSCVIDDGWQGGNRGDYSSGAGHSVTQSVYWNSTGTGSIGSWNYGVGYVIGTAAGMSVQTGSNILNYHVGALPVDYTEGLGLATTLEPQSLFEDQLARRMINKVGRTWAVFE